MYISGPPIIVVIGSVDRAGIYVNIRNHKINLNFILPTTERTREKPTGGEVPI